MMENHMKSIIWKALLIMSIGGLFSFAPGVAEAARQFTVTQTHPAPPALSVMGSSQSITYRVTNTSTGAQSGETIRIVRFRLKGTCLGAPCTATAFSAATTAPAGWTKTTSTATTITFTANTVADQITAAGTNYKDFTLTHIAGQSTQDRAETLRDIRSTYSSGNRVTVNTPGSWTLKSLSITSFQTIDTCATGNPISSLTSGNNFSLLMTVRNNSSVAQNGIVSNPNPPTATKTGTVTQALISTTYNPNPLNLASGASGTICFTYSTNAADNGTIYFTANAQRGATVTSATATSNTLTVSRLTISMSVRGPIVASPTCVFSGDTATFTMTATNNTGAAVTNVTPSALTQCAYPPCIPTVTIGAFTGPLPACIASIANGASGTFTWTAPVTGTLNNPKSNFYVTGNVNYNKAACGAGGGTTSVTTTSNTEDVDGYIVSVNPTSTNAGSANEELVWSVANYGCATIQSVSVDYPAGWTWTGGDSYSLVSNNNLETWTVGGANPPVVFTAPAPADQLPQLQTGSFSLAFPQTPTITGAYTFNVTITDANAAPIVKTLPTTVTVNPYDSTLGQGNYTVPGIWRESY